MEATLNERAVGICPACSEAVYNSREGDGGPVWTCPADLGKSNPYWEPSVLSDAQVEKNEREGYFGLCAEDSGDNHGQCHERMPLHGACYDKGNY